MDYLNTAIELAKEAGRVQLEHLGKVKNIEYKGSINIVTEVDKLCEKLIVDTIQKKYPTHDILAEEGSGQRSNSDWRWIIDPIDGTTNFAHTYPLFACTMALEHKGEIVMGVVYEPNRDELFVAEKGSGATLNGVKLKVSQENVLKKSLLCTGFAYNVNEEEQFNNIDNFKNFMMSARAIRRDGVASTDLCYVACGRFEGFWEFYLKPWDIAAGTLIINEAGGSVTMFDGSPINIYGDEILASNGHIHDDMVRILTKKV